ncbi:MAG: hypothetical protein KAU21_01565, partial [Gammaproteobacteria bacterium]|nr:hypothetical protein [Gammaproteobacteria bacterium]
MNLYVNSEYIENIQRLALGIMPIDPIIGRATMLRVRAEIEHQSPHFSLNHKATYYQAQRRGKLPAVLNRHRAGRYTLLYYPTIKEEIIVRLYDYQRF